MFQQSIDRVVREFVDHAIPLLRMAASSNSTELQALVAVLGAHRLQLFSTLSERLHRVQHQRDEARPAISHGGTLADRLKDCLPSLQELVNEESDAGRQALLEVLGDDYEPLCQALLALGDDATRAWVLERWTVHYVDT